jgi:phage terminase large subunit GpA-like protein
MTLHSQLSEILDFSRLQLSDIKPSDWAEQNMVVSSGKFQGRLSYDRTPYSREIVDCFSPYHYATEVTLMGGAQFGKSTTVVEPIIAYTISEDPCNMGFLTGHSDLSEEAMVKLDSAIHNANIGHLIRPSLIKPRNTRTGDTNKVKEFIGGSIVSGSATNHKLLRQRSWQKILADDLEAAKSASKESGSTIALIRERAKSFGNSKKILWCSTPENKQTSLILPLFLAGDQRRWHWVCPCCGEWIYLQWVAPVIGSEDKAGFTWRLDSAGKLVAGSVEYICQVCSKSFDESHKYELNLNGKWIPQAVAEDPTHLSYHLPSLYAMPGMNGWEQAVRDYLKANPGNGQPVNKSLMRTFVNLTLGECYEEEQTETSAKSIMRNTRRYEPGIVPESVSRADGNGDIMLLTCAADLNGFVEDARLDYEIVGWSKAGASYSIIHGSIGTFVRGEGKLKGKTDREQWSYDAGQPNNVWQEFSRVLDTVWNVDTGRKMKVYITGLDTGNFTAHAYEFMDRTNHYVLGLKGDVDTRYIKTKLDRASWKIGKGRADLYILEVNMIKDTLSEYMELNWDRKQDMQPYGFMNFPQPNDGLYGFENFFEHFESEHNVYSVNSIGESVSRWEKKNSNVQNHMWDCRIYNMAMRELFLYLAGKGMKVKDFTWDDFCTAAI